VISNPAGKDGSEAAGRCTSPIMLPHPNYFDKLFFLENLVDRSMLDIDTSREGAFEITKHFFVSRRTLIRICL
jgi:hypothetical protein